MRLDFEIGFYLMVIDLSGICKNYCSGMIKLALKNNECDRDRADTPHHA